MKSYKTGFPVFSICSVGKNGEFLVGGGGGGSNAGVKNSVILFKVDAFTLEMDEVAEHQFEKEDDGCMSLAAHPIKKSFFAGVNCSADIVKMGDNINARFFYIQNKSLHYSPEYSLQTLKSTNPDHYQKVCKFSKDGKIFAAGTSDGMLSFWAYPAMSPSLPSQTFDGNPEIMDLHMDAANIVVVASSKIRVLDLVKGKIRWVLERVQYKSVDCIFRGARFGAGESDGILYVFLNASSKKAAYIQQYDTNTWSLIKTKKVSSKPITAMSLSEKGGLIACGSSDMSVSILDSHSLKVIKRVIDAHSFPVTAIDINADATVVLSGSADGSISVITVPDPLLDSQGWSMGSIALFLILLFFILAFLIEGEEL